MKLTIRKAAALLLLSILNSQLFIVRAQGTAFTYQGRLDDGGSPANGIYDLRFTIYDSNNSPGNVIAGPVTNAATAVDNGLFTVTLDFGAGVFTGPARWLQVEVRTNGGGDFTALFPRQPLTATPYAMLAGAIVPGGIPAGVYTNAVIFNSPGNQFFGSGSGLTNLNASALSSGTLSLAQLPGTVLTNGAQLAFIGQTNFTAYSPNSFSLSSCTHFPFLNGFWQLNTMNGYWVHSATNFAFFDVVNLNGLLFCSSTLYDPTLGNVFLMDFNAQNPLYLPWNQAGQFTLNDYATPDGAYITNGVAYTNIQTVTVGANSLNITGINGGQVPLLSIFDAAGQPMYSLSIEGENSLSDNIFEEMWGSSVGIPWTNRLGGFQALRINGALLQNPNADKRGQALVGFVFGNDGRYGASMEHVIRYDTTYSNAQTGRIFASSIVQDSKGSVQLGNRPYSAHGMKDDAPAWVEIWGGTADKPALLLPGGSLYTGTTTNGAIQSDGTNVWITQRGLTQIPLTGASPQNGSGLTNLNASSLTGSLSTAILPGITTNVSNGGITFYITNGLIMRVSSP